MNEKVVRAAAAADAEKTTMEILKEKLKTAYAASPLSPWPGMK